MPNRHELTHETRRSRQQLGQVARIRTPRAARGVHLYLRAIGELEDRAIAVDLAPSALRDLDVLVLDCHGSAEAEPFPFDTVCLHAIAAALSGSSAALPDAPGVYRFLRPNGDVLYVGKAASLKKQRPRLRRAVGIATECAGPSSAPSCKRGCSSIARALCRSRGRS